MSFFTRFSNEQKDKFIEFVMSVPLRKYRAAELKEQKHKFGKNWLDYDCYWTLNLIPLDERNKYPEAKRKFQEYERKFGIIVKENHGDGEVTDNNPRPSNRLPERAYKVMSLEQWKSLMKTAKTDNQLSEEFGPRHSRPTQEGHSYALEEEVKHSPDKYLPLVRDIVKMPEIPEVFKVNSLYALNESKIDLVTKLTIYKDCIETGIDENAKRRLCLYLQNLEIEDEETVKYFVEFLITCAESSEIPQRYVKGKTRLIHTFTSSLPGAAIFSLLNFIHKSNLQVYEVFWNIALRRNTVLDFAILYVLRYRISHFDEERAFRLFEVLVDTENIEVLEISIYSLKDLVGLSYVRASPFIKKLIGINFFDEGADGVNSIDALAQVIAWANYVNKSPGVELLDLVFQGDNEPLRAALLRHSIHVVSTWESDWEGALSFIERFYIEHSHMLSAGSLDVMFINGKRYFERWFPIIVKAVELNGVAVLNYQIISALTSYGNLLCKYSTDILGLLERLDFARIEPNQHATAIPAYFSLLSQVYIECEYEGDRALLSSILDIYDKCLKVPALRRSFDENKIMRKYD